MIGGILGMIAGRLVPHVVIGLYALDGPEPAATFNPMVWGIEQGTMYGLVWGIGLGLLASLVRYFLFWRRSQTRHV
jgi:hypothetical protein